MLILGESGAGKELVAKSIHLGSVKRVPINVRILAATNRDLERSVAEGSFRHDLFFRLNVLALLFLPWRAHKYRNLS